MSSWRNVVLIFPEDYFTYLIIYLLNLYPVQFLQAGSGLLATYKYKKLHVKGKLFWTTTILNLLLLNHYTTLEYVPLRDILKFSGTQIYGKASSCIWKQGERIIFTGLSRAWEVLKTQAGLLFPKLQEKTGGWWELQACPALLISRTLQGSKPMVSCDHSLSVCYMKWFLMCLYILSQRYSGCALACGSLIEFF